ncbi:MAG: ABC transporter substrate-binding protein [Chloroflexi bacterium]|nr:ABC transporter substrate-binding protein [Chloroflexota bacterium]
MVEKKLLKVGMLNLIAVLLLSLALYGCGGAAPSPTATSAAPAATKPTTAPQATKPATGAPASTPAASPAAAKPTGNPIKVGYMAPFTGRMANNGLLQQTALKLALEDINAAGGINGNPLEVVTFDSPFDPQQSVTGIRKLAEQDKVFAIVGPYSSAEAEAVAHIANQLQVPLISTTAAKDGIFPKNRPWAFGYLSLDVAGLPIAIDAYKKVYPNVKKMVIVGDAKESVSENIVKNLFPKFLKEKGFEVIDTVPYETGTTDFSAIVTKVKGLNPDGIALSDVLPINIAKELERQQVKLPVVTGYQVQPTPFLGTVGAAGEGWVCVRYSTIENPDPTFQKFLSRFNQAIAAANLKVDQVSLEPGVYDVLTIIAEIMRKDNVTSSSNLQQARTVIRDGFANLKDRKGLYGSVSMSSDGVTAWQTYPHLAKNGKWQLVK